MEKTDLTKKHKEYYSATQKPGLVKFGPIAYLTISGVGDPNGEEFAVKTSALYPVAYAVKKICKESGKDFAVAKLEGLWWVTGNKPAMQTPRSEWHWKLLIRMPEYVTVEMVKQATDEVLHKKKILPAAEVQLVTIDEGRMVSILHTGPYAEEPATLAKMEEMMKENRLAVNGRHHEIYLTDPHKTAPVKMKTILRQPVK